MSVERTFLGFALTASAGWVDAVGLTRLYDLHLSFMSGNTTELGEALSREQWSLGAMAAAVLALFFVGSFLSGLMGALTGRSGLTAVLILEALLIATALGLSAGEMDREAIFLLPVAMGIQNGAIYRLHPGATTFVTGTLFRAGHELGRSILGDRDAPWLSQLLTWASFAGGALSGALGNARWGMAALVFPVGVAAASAALVLSGAVREEMGT